MRRTAATRTASPQPDPTAVADLAAAAAAAAVYEDNKKGDTGCKEVKLGIATTPAAAASSTGGLESTAKSSRTKNRHLKTPKSAEKTKDKKFCVPDCCGYMCDCVVHASCTSTVRVPACGGCVCSCTVAHFSIRSVGLVQPPTRSRPVRGNSGFTAADSRAALNSLLGSSSKSRG